MILNTTIAVGLLVLLVVLYLFHYRRNFRKITTYNLEGVKKLVPPGFNFTRIRVETDDGYILSLFNLRHKSNYTPAKRPVLFHHGLGNSGANWLMGGAHNSAACNLAKQGHDIYLGNARGNVYCLEHKWLDKNSKEFWDYSFQDMRYDIKAFMEHIHNKTGKLIHYISHSQGSVAMLAALADVDRDIAEAIDSKLHTFYCFSPVVYTKKTRMVAFKVGKVGIEPLKKFMDRLGIYGMTGAPEKVNTWKMETINSMKKINKKLAFSWVDRTNKFNNTDLFGTFNAFHPHGMSFQTIHHFMQIHKLGGRKYFKKFDYGPEVNMKKYGSAEPPSYDFGLVTARVKLYYGDQDRYLDPSDMEMLIEDLCNADLEVNMMKDYGHVSFTLGTNNYNFYQNLIDESGRTEQVSR